MTPTQNINIQTQNLKTLSYLDFNCDLTNSKSGFL